MFGQFVDHDLDLEQVGSTAINIPLPGGGFIPLNSAGPPPATNTVAGFLDLSQVYGSDDATAASLRKKDGTLQSSAGNALPIVNGSFVAGDVRVMENPELTAVQTLFLREHNFWVGQLHSEHPDWSGDQLYQTPAPL